MKIIDNFLDPAIFISLEQVLFSPNFLWNYTEGLVTPEDDNFQFVHLFYTGAQGGKPTSNYWGIMEHIIKKIAPISLFRIKANLRTRTTNIEEADYHSDMSVVPGVIDDKLHEKIKHWTTSILYMNTNDGYTKFEDGTKVECIANRFVSFPSNINHAGTTCTDQKKRVVINFNYYK
jgi:hypothetical protein